MQHDPCELQSVHLSIWKLLNSSVCLCETSKCYAVRPCTWLSLCPCNSWQNVWKDLSAKNETWMVTGLEFRLFRILKQWLDPYILCMSGAEIATAIFVTTNPSLLECECHRSSTACISSSFPEFVILWNSTIVDPQISQHACPYVPDNFLPSFITLLRLRVIRGTEIAS